jgi:putative exporter of polyketide antibiotics
MIAPALVLAAILAVFHVSAYVFVRGRAGARVPMLLVAAFLGAWAGDALAGRLDADPVRIGDFHVLGASLFAWIGIAVVAILAVMAPTRAERGQPAPERSRSANAG